MLTHAGGGELIWVVIVIGSAIVQMIKAKKKASQPAQKPQDSQDSSPHSDELRDFLQAISGAPPVPPPAPPPQPVRTAAAQTQPPRPHHTRPAPPPLPPSMTIKHRPAPVKPHKPAERHRPKPPELVLKPTPEKQVKPAITKITPLATATPKGLAALIIQDLKNMDSTRKAIVLREILGPPIALRRSRN